MTRLFVILMLLLTSITSQAKGFVTGAVVGGAVGAVVGSSMSKSHASSADMVIDLESEKDKVIVYQSYWFVETNHKDIVKFVTDNHYKYYKVSKIIARANGSDERFYYLIKVWN